MYKETAQRMRRDRGREGECCPVFWAITHQTSPPSPHHHPEKTKQCPDITVEGSGGEGRQGGKLGNQMWSIKTYWHAEGLPLPHSHTESTNSFNRPRYTHVPHIGCTNHIHMHNQACKIIHKIMLKKQMLKNKQMHKSCASGSRFLIKHVSNRPKTCRSSCL